MTTAYNVQINEFQRHLIRLLCEIARTHPEVRSQVQNIAGDESAGSANALEDVELLKRMLDQLPQDEAKHPGVTHGLCL